MNKKPTPDLSTLLGGARKTESTPSDTPIILGYATPVTSVEELSVATPKPRKTREGKRPSADLTERWTRATFVIREQYNDDLRDLAWYKRVTIKELLDEALNAYLQKYEVELKAAHRERKKHEEDFNA